ncbi:hypothetical protein [Aurantiacibacter gilvus]|uniref:Lipoprotein n=1 Tax=Aurantiacibacter gilvus TaxID=3139141 RepID=A0ABU9IF66_9SPHN
MKRIVVVAAAMALSACQQQEEQDSEQRAQMEIPADLLERYEFSPADTPNKRIALVYLYSAWNDGELADARATYWVPGYFPPVIPQYRIHRVIEEGDQVVVLALVEGIGIGDEITTIFGTPGGTKIGDAVVEVMRFDPATGLIAEKVDIIEPMSEESYDFR